MKLVGLLVLSIFSAFSFANDNCEPKNLLTQTTSPFGKIPVYDQDGTEMCYAYSAAQLIDYHLMKRGSQKRAIHPAWVALVHSQDKKQDQLNGGHTDSAIRALTKLQNCPYEYVSAAINKWASKANVTEAEVLDLIERFAPKIKSSYTTTNGKQITVPPARIKQAFQEAVNEHMPHSCSPNPQWNNLLSELETLSVMTSEKMISQLLMPNCRVAKNAIIIPPPRFVRFNQDNQVHQGITHKLEVTNAPVSFSHCANFWQNPSYDGIPDDRNRLNFSNDCNRHESIVVGKKRMDGACHFLVRNSWGSNWSRNNEKYKCMCRNKNTGALVDDCNSRNHNDGNWIVEACWVHTNIISKNTEAMTTLE